MNEPQIRVEPDAAALARAVAAAAAELAPRSLVVTGGSILEAALAELRSAPVDWTGVDVWWGDERFLPAGDPERNETAARAALLDHVPARVHPMPADDGRGLETAAAGYAAELPAAFDLALIGVGPDGHVCSLFPHHPALEEPGPVVAVRASPKPPPERLSLSLAALRTCREVWLVVSGEPKATAVAAALGGADPAQLPAAAVRGADRTVWWLDAPAASRLPRSVEGDFLVL